MKTTGQDVTKEFSMGKLFGFRLVNKVMDGCLQMHGGMGYMKEMHIARAFLDSRLIAIGGGADEIMCEIIAGLTGLKS